ncbi:autotransporter assembly complex protein TamA [Polaromonas sp. SM01]|uniref:autotransporter assembly complex protein TamA n=1 Tax=Polaromonas sp. SM01 TaxID=3085630 RepID=UPI002982A9A8|nr:BamA/TamA family outer membrane protein [Polaromonas sp. SM01]MDW5442173.1 BamA/TamA family outer membrane protein [Polaromonas sp. SM01]
MTPSSIYRAWRAAGAASIAALALFLLASAAAAQTVAPAPPVTATTLAPSGAAQTAPPPEPPPASVTLPPTPEGSVGPTDAGSDVTAFDIRIEAPPELQGMLERHLQLQRYRAVTDLDDAELARLVVLAEGDVRNLVGTLGYFSPDIRITRSAPANQRPTIVVTVVPGEATQIAKVGMAFMGDIGDSPDPQAQSQRTSIERNWRLPVGRRFTQDAWDSAKTQALRELVAKRYPAGDISYSLADVDAPARSAQLSLTLNSGPLYRLGPLQVSGVERYDPLLVQRLAQLTPGDVYDQRQLTDAQQRLAASGYFDSVSIFVDPKSDPAAAPVQVQVREAKLQKIVLGVGLTTDSGPRASIEHTHNNVSGLNWRATTKLQLERKSPFAQTEWTTIPDADNWRWVALGRAERLDDGALITRAQRLRVGRAQNTQNIDRNFYLQYDRASIQGSGVNSTTDVGTGDGSAITANFAWAGRYFDSLPFPRRGYGIGIEFGAGTTLGTHRYPFTRTNARWMGILPLQRDRIALRAEVGAVLASDEARVPATQLFRTGGDTTVRGYGLRDIGITLPGGVVGPGRYMAVASAEWQRPIMKDGLPTDWENTVFIDAGNVADKAADLRNQVAVGVGTGVRWKSPIGPLQIDLAYGVRPKKFRLHMNVGFVF